MIEVKNKMYVQRFFAHELQWTDFFRAVTYTQYEGDNKIPFWYKKRRRNTITLDLTGGMDAIYSNMRSNTRNEIKRAEKEGVTIEFNHDYAAFVVMYNNFTKSKGLSDEVDIPTLAKYDGMMIAVARHGDTVLAMHATVINMKDKEAMLLYSCSPRLEDGVDRKLIGWGNRYLHYEEFKYMVQYGIERYEWNGVCIDPEDKARYNIGLFKQGFGGKTKPSVHLKTPLFVFMKNIQLLLINIRKILN